MKHFFFIVSRGPIMQLLTPFNCNYGASSWMAFSFRKHTVSL